ncbi:hypothetical protein ACU8KH_01021 [Lachancea thermotolerans]
MSESSKGVLSWPLHLLSAENCRLELEDANRRRRSRLIGLVADCSLVRRTSSCFYRSRAICQRSNTTGLIVDVA